MITSLVITNYHSPDAHLIGGLYFSLSLNSFKLILIFQKGSLMLSYASSPYLALIMPQEQMFVSLTTNGCRLGNTCATGIISPTSSKVGFQCE